ncbi:MAG: uroporphyrinogen-III C-methyltransferase [Acidaminococcaceae bacterium]|nr:uroporphyrinogen-III C-methyltransferase [Acidaminococcaceae bacterium]
MTKNGKVYLIGAGPGDPGLLSIKAMECLQMADAVVYDRLADPRILAYAKPTAEMVYVGKASAQHTMQQPDINKLLVQLASEGKIVARLKGGDPFVFGRGGEEALELLAARLPFEFVPGITSAIAVAEYAGIPVTHRNIAASFAVITGHENPDKESSSINWSGLATAVDTLVFLMGVENLANITKQLIAHGRSADTPAAVIRWGTKPEQRTLVTTVGNAAADVAAAQLKPPAIFIVGNVVKLREQLNWFENKPLFGKTIVVTRARAQASALTKRLETDGARVIEVPAIKIVPPASFGPLDKAIDDITAYKWLVFTSVNGVLSFYDRLFKSGKDIRALAHLQIAAIGLETAAALKDKGIYADIVPSAYKAEELAKSMAPYIIQGVKVLLVRAKVAREILPDTLRTLGAVVDVVPAYETVTDCPNLEMLTSALKNSEVDLVTFTSSSTVTNLLDALGNDARLLKNIKTAVIGPITAATCQKQGLTTDIIATDFTISGLINAINNYYKE